MPIISGATSLAGISTVGENVPWSLIVVPDTQRLAANNADAYNALFQWIVDNKAAENIQMVIHLGDYVNAAGNSTQWSRVDTAVNRLHTANIPFIHSIGNWDYDNGNADTTRSTATHWESVFPASDWSGYDWYVGEYNGVTTNQAATLTLGGVKYLFLTLEVFPRDAAISWADGIISTENPDRIILGTHMLVDEFGNHQEYGGDAPDDYGFCGYSQSGDCATGLDLYNEFVSQHDNIILTVNGHDLTLALGNEFGYAKRVDTVNGNPINQHFFNFQNDASNNYADSAVLRQYKINSASANVTTFNPVQDFSYTDSDNQFTFNFN